MWHEIYLDFLPSDTYLTPGIWAIRLIPQKLRDGSWNMWLPSSAIRNETTAFLLPSPDTTLTIPSTSARAITVGAYDSRQNSMAAFSGRGYTLNDQFVKPDLVAPGVDIISCAPGALMPLERGPLWPRPLLQGQPVY